MMDEAQRGKMVQAIRDAAWRRGCNLRTAFIAGLAAEAAAQGLTEAAWRAEWYQHVANGTWLYEGLAEARAALTRQGLWPDEWADHEEPPILTDEERELWGLN